MEMELYKELAALRCFTHSDMVRLAGTEGAAQWQIRNCLRKGYIERIRRDLYAVISMETAQPIPNRFQITSRISEDSYVSHHSAFEYYGYANQVFYDVYFGSEKKVRPFTYDGLQFLPVVWRGGTQILETNTGVRVTSLERTVIDSIADFPRIGGLEEFLRCLGMIPSLDPGKLLEILASYDRGQLYQKAGYILEVYADELSLPGSFFEECASHLSVSKTYLFDRQDDFVLHKRWLIYAPKDLKRLVEKGAYVYDTV